MKLMLSIFLLLTLAANATEGDSITAYVSAPQVKRNQPFEVGIKYTGTHRYRVRIKEVEGIKVFSGPNSSHEMQMTNGVTTNSGSYSYRLMGSIANTYQIQIEVTKEDSTTSTYKIAVEVLQEAWSKQDELAKSQEEYSNPFNDDFFRDYKQPQASPSKPQAQQYSKPLSRKDMAKLVSFQPQFTTYDAAVGKAALVRYVVRFNKASEQYNNLPEMYLVKLPHAKYVYVEMQGSDELSIGARGGDEQAQQITLAAHCEKPGKFTLSPLVIHYNGKRYKAAKVILNTIYKGESIEI